MCGPMGQREGNAWVRRPMVQGLVVPLLPDVGQSQPRRLGGKEDRAAAFTQTKELFWLLRTPSCTAEK